MRLGEQILSTHSSSLIQDEAKIGDSAGINLMPQINPTSDYLMSYANLSSMNSPSKSRQIQFINLYEVVNTDYYEKEASFIKISPEEDRREVILDTTIYPFSSHGRLLMIFDGKAVYGSGTLINSRFVLTAAHNLYPKYFKKEPDSILFIPALNGNKCPYGIIGVRRYFYPEEFEDARYEDYALLELEEDIGDTTGYIEMRKHTAEDIDNIDCSLYGYPGYVYNQDKKNDYLYGMNGRVSLNEDRNVLKYTIDTEGGMSGSSIYYKSQEDNKYNTIGVHVKGYRKQAYNAGTYLTAERIENIQVWIESHAIPTKHNLAQLTSDLYGRYSELETLKNFMKTHSKLGVICLCGVPGVGKSTIALNYATACKGRYDYIWWINSETEDTFRIDVLSLANTLNIEGKTYQQKLNKLKSKLNSQDIQFLLIFDNLQDENIAQELITARGHFIITSRLEQPYENIDVKTLSREASVQLLSSRLSR